MADLVTIEGVEIGSVGMKWRAGNSDLTLTLENLRDVMVAANDDPHIVPPRLKLGHEGWPEMDGLDCNPFGTSAEPALGRVTNLRLTNDGATLVGDYTDVPAWVPAAYPSRSGEWLGQVEGHVLSGVTTPGGKHYSMVLTAVALLGVCAPAISDLEDLQSFLTTGTTSAGQVTIATNREEPGVAPVATRADIDTVQRSFWSDFAQGDMFWWWPRDIYTDPNEVLADDDEGHLFRVPFTSGDDGEVTWGEPTRVRIDLVDLPPLETPAAAMAVVAASHRAVLATQASTHRSFTDAGQARPADRHTQRAAEQVAAAATQAATERSDPEEGLMPDITPDMLQRLRALPEDADQEQITAALSGEPPAPDEPETPVTPEPEAEVTPEVDAIDQTRDIELAAATQRLADLEQRETERQQRETAAQRDATVAGWVREGRIAPAERDHYRGLLDIDEQRATSLAESLAPGRIPVSPMGVTPEPELAATASDGLPGHWFPQLADRDKTTITTEA